MVNSHVKTILLAAMWIVGVASCSTKPDQSRVVPLSELTNASLSANGVWESVPWSGAPWLSYPAASTLQIEHGLGRVPSTITVYVSFVSTGQGAAESTGDISRIAGVTDTTVSLQNAMQEDYFLRLVLE